ncbi:MAG: copper amine oxidase N-terminal domain-containing protein [Bacillota bacterium]
MVPFAGAATYSPAGAMSATAGQDNQLGAAQITVSAALLQTGDWVDIKLPADFKFFPNAQTQATAPWAVGVGTHQYSNGFVTITAPTAGNALTNGALSQLTTEFTVVYRDDNRIRLTYTGAATVWDAQNTNVNLVIRFNTVYVPSGHSGDIKAEFASAPGMAFSDGSVVIGSVGAGTAKIKISEVNTRNSSGGAIADITITEDRPGALSATANSIKLKLPSGVTWRAASVTAATSTLEYGDGAVVLPNAVAGVGVDDLTTAASGRELIIPFNAAAGTTTTAATSFTISGLQIDIDETTAKTGDIEVSISGDSTITPGSLVVAKYAEFGIKKVEAFTEPKEVRAGRMDEEIGKIVIEEAIGDSLISGRTVTLTLVGGAKWNTPPRQDTSNSKNYDLTAFTAVGTAGEVVRATVGANTSRAVLVLEKGSVDVSAAALDSDVKVIVGGTAGATGEVVVAKIVKPVTATIEGAVPNVKIGTSAQPIAPIIITENAKEAIDDAAGANIVRIEFFAGVIPSLPTSVTVVEGDIDLNTSMISRNVNADGRWYIDIPVTSSSYKASKIKVDGIKVTTDRTVPEGAMVASIKGTALVQTIGLFPGATSVGSVVVANVVSKVEGGEANAAAFVIGSTTYTLNGAAMTMDVAPYVRDGRTYLPIRYVATALGVADNNILWDSATGTVTLLKGDKVVQVVVGSKTMTVNGASIAMDVAPEIKDGRTMLPFRWIAWAFNADVEWDATAQTVNMKL